MDKVKAFFLSRPMIRAYRTILTGAISLALAYGVPYISGFHIPDDIKLYITGTLQAVLMGLDKYIRDNIPDDNFQNFVSNVDEG
jgi:hypothetical protein